MKLPILILLLFAPIFTANAQSSRVETTKDGRVETYFYRKGGDSVHLTILEKKDTIKKKFFYPSGKIKQISWKQDSSYFFDTQGRHYETDFGLNPKDYDKDNYIKFYPNGQPLIFKSNQNRQKIVRKYAENGRLLLSSVTKSTDSSQTLRVEDRNGVPIFAERIDTFEKGKNPIGRIYDTSFYDNGQPCIIYSKGFKDEFYGNQVFNRDGSLNYALPPDSLGLIVFGCITNLHLANVVGNFSCRVSYRGN